MPPEARGSSSRGRTFCPSEIFESVGPPLIAVEASPRSESRRRVPCQIGEWLRKHESTRGQPAPFLGRVAAVCVLARRRNHRGVQSRSRAKSSFAVRSGSDSSHAHHARPHGLEGILPRAPVPRRLWAGAMGRTDLAVSPRVRQTLQKAIEIRIAMREHVHDARPRRVRRGGAGPSGSHRGAAAGRAWRARRATDPSSIPRSPATRAAARTASPARDTACWTRAPIRFFSASLNEGWKKFTNSRDAAYSRDKRLARRRRLRAGRSRRAGGRRSRSSARPTPGRSSIRPRTRELDAGSAQYARSVSLMNSLPLSVSMPRSGNGIVAKRRAPRRPSCPRAPAGDAFGPAARDVGEHQRVREAAGHALAAVRDQVRLDEAGRRIIPVGKRAHGNAAPNRWRRPGSRVAAACRRSGQTACGRSSRRSLPGPARGPPQSSFRCPWRSSAGRSTGAAA